MDTHHVELPVSRAEAVRRAVEHVVAGDDAVLCVGFDAGAVLDNVSDVLAERRLRVLRCSASGQGGLSLSGLLAQITGRPDLGSHDDEVLQRGFQALTTHGEDCDGVVLLIEGAQALQRSALRYLQFIGRTTPGPRFVLASEGGEPDLYDVGLTFLRTRLAAMPVLVVAGGVGGVPLLPGTASAAGSVVGPVPLPVVTPHLVPPALSRAWLDAVPLPLTAHRSIWSRQLRQCPRIVCWRSPRTSAVTLDRCSRQPRGCGRGLGGGPLRRGLAWVLRWRPASRWVWQSAGMALPKIPPLHSNLHSRCQHRYWRTQTGRVRLLRRCRSPATRPTLLRMPGRHRLRPLLRPSQRRCRRTVRPFRPIPLAFRRRRWPTPRPSRPRVRG